MNKIKIQKLGNYKGLTVPAVETEVNEEIITAQLNILRVENAKVQDLPEDTIADDGDITVIDYCGRIDGMVFAGGTGNNYPLELGSHTFIPGFEEQLIGTKAGDTKDVVVSFPADYPEAYLAGKEAIFTCTIHKIQRKILPELDDAFAREVSDYQTLDEMKAYLAEEYIAQKKAIAAQQWEDRLLAQIVSESIVSIPTEMLAARAEKMHMQAQMELSQQGASLEQYLQQMGMTPEQFQDQMLERAKQMLKQHAVMTAIAEAEGCTVTNEEFYDAIAALAAQYHMDPDQVLDIFGEEGANDFRADLLAKKGLAIITKNV